MGDASLIALLPGGPRPDERQTFDLSTWYVVELFVLAVLLASVFVAASIGEEIEDRTIDVSVVAPPAALDVIAGKLLALAPVAMRPARCRRLALAMQVATMRPTGCGRSLGVRRRRLAISIVAAGIAMLVPSTACRCRSSTRADLDLIDRRRFRRRCSRQHHAPGPAARGISDTACTNGRSGRARDHDGRVIAGAVARVGLLEPPPDSSPDPRYWPKQPSFARDASRSESPSASDHARSPASAAISRHARQIELVGRVAGLVIAARVGRPEEHVRDARACRTASDRCARARPPMPTCSFG